jgi:hypothetical protein
MIILQYSCPWVIVRFRDWLFKIWFPPKAPEEGWEKPVTWVYPPRCAIVFNGWIILKVIGLRILGLEFCWIQVRECQ